MNPSVFIIIGFILLWLAPICWMFWQDDLDHRAEWHWFKDTVICIGILIMYFASVSCFFVSFCVDMQTDKPLAPYKVVVAQHGTEKSDTTYHYNLFK